MSFWDDVWDDVKSVAEVAAPILGGIGGAIVGGPLGAVAGAKLGGAVSGWIDGDDDDSPDLANMPLGSQDFPGGLNSLPARTTGTGLAFGGGQGGLFAPPTGGLQGPVYGTQGALSTGAQNALATVVETLRAWPIISKALQRLWDFPTSTVVAVPKRAALWRALAHQVPASHRDALEQFLVGFPSPVGLSKAASDVFLTLKIAEAGYDPESIGCCGGLK